MTGLILPQHLYRQPSSGGNQMPVQQRQHFLLDAPLETHWRPATCHEVDCPKWLNGYEIRVDISDRADITIAKLKYLRDGNISRDVVEYKDQHGWAVFRFPPFTRIPGHENMHRIRIDRPEIFRVWNVTSGYVTHRGRNNGADDWADQFANHQDEVAPLFEKKLGG